MNNETITIENFINFCDNMMIANEGLFDKSKSKPILQRLMPGYYATKLLKPNGSLKSNSDTTSSNKKSHIFQKSKSKVNSSFMETLKYNDFDTDDYELMTPEETKECEQKLLPEYKRIMIQIKSLVSSINSKYKDKYFEFIKQGLVKYEIKKTTRSISISGYAIGYKYLPVQNNPEENSKINKAWDELEEQLEKIVSSSKFISNCNICKHNCDGYPEYVNDYHRFYWLYLSTNIHMTN